MSSFFKNIVSLDADKYPVSKDKISDTADMSISVSSYLQGCTTSSKVRLGRRIEDSASIDSKQSVRALSCSLLSQPRSEYRRIVGMLSPAIRRRVLDDCQEIRKLMDSACIAYDAELSWALSMAIHYADPAAITVLEDRFSENTLPKEVLDWYSVYRDNRHDVRLDVLESKLLPYDVRVKDDDVADFLSEGIAQENALDALATAGAEAVSDLSATSQLALSEAEEKVTEAADTFAREVGAIYEDVVKQVAGQTIENAVSGATEDVLEESSDDTDASDVAEVEDADDEDMSEGGDMPSESEDTDPLPVDDFVPMTESSTTSDSVINSPGDSSVLVVRVLDSAVPDLLNMHIYSAYSEGGLNNVDIVYKDLRYQLSFTSESVPNGNDWVSLAVSRASTASNEVSQITSFGGDVDAIIPSAVTALYQDMESADQVDTNSGEDVVSGSVDLEVSDTKILKPSKVHKRKAMSRRVVSSKPERSVRYSQRNDSIHKHEIVDSMDLQRALDSGYKCDCFLKDHPDAVLSIRPRHDALYDVLVSQDGVQQYDFVGIDKDSDLAFFLFGLLGGLVEDQNTGTMEDMDLYPIDPYDVVTRYDLLRNHQGCIPTAVTSGESQYVDMSTPLMLVRNGSTYTMCTGDSRESLSELCALSDAEVDTIMSHYVHDDGYWYLGSVDMRPIMDASLGDVSEFRTFITNLINTGDYEALHPRFEEDGKGGLLLVINPSGLDRAVILVGGNGSYFLANFREKWFEPSVYPLYQDLRSHIEDYIRNHPVKDGQSCILMDDESMLSDLGLKRRKVRGGSILSMRVSDKDLPVAYIQDDGTTHIHDIGSVVPGAFPAVCKSLVKGAKSVKYWVKDDDIPANIVIDWEAVSFAISTWYSSISVGLATNATDESIASAVINLGYALSEIPYLSTRVDEANSLIYCRDTKWIEVLPQGLSINSTMFGYQVEEDAIQSTAKFVANSAVVFAQSVYIDHDVDESVITDSSKERKALLDAIEVIENNRDWSGWPYLSDVSFLRKYPKLVMVMDDLLSDEQKQDVVDELKREIRDKFKEETGIELTDSFIRSATVTVNQGQQNTYDAAHNKTTFDAIRDSVDVLNRILRIAATMSGRTPMSVSEFLSYVNLPETSNEWISLDADLRNYIDTVKYLALSLNELDLLCPSLYKKKLSDNVWYSEDVQEVLSCFGITTISDVTDLAEVGGIVLSTSPIPKYIDCELGTHEYTTPSQDVTLYVGLVRTL